ncbi:S9 family peptidase [Membranihabitans maritimus]|uniref:S9 family peptidase n=1 Tax=Membranihabitans maritimus TaxID=2904244 RepID=UPI001F33742D|nr:S9 family peptidase [Membranihabitans maritimus]
MAMHLRIFLGGIFFLLCVPAGKCQQSSSLSKKEIWKEIDTYFIPPEKLKSEFGDFRSPLQFYDGESVGTAKEWGDRRREIKEQWMEMMGEWPPFIKDQEFTITESQRRENFIQHTVTFKWTPNETTKGYLLIPDGKGKRPAVITVYYEPETAIGEGKSPHRDFAYQLAKRGFVTLSLGTSEASEAKTYSLYYPNIKNAEVEPLSMLGYAAANAWYALSKRPEVDSDRIGIMGHSFGGKWAMFASCLFDKFACSAWSDPGIVFQNDRPSINYWEPWYLGYHPKPWRERGLITKENPAEGLYPKLIREGYNLQELHALSAPRPFLVSGGSEDPVEQWIPLNHTRKVNELLGYENRVAMTNRPDHSPNEQSNSVIYLFFEYFLK